MYLFFSRQHWARLPEYFCLFPNTNSWYQLLIPKFPTTFFITSNIHLFIFESILNYCLWTWWWFWQWLKMRVYIYISRLAFHNIFCDERYRYSLKETLSAGSYQQLLAVSGELTLGWLSCRDTEKSLNLQLFTGVWMERFVNALPVRKVLTFIYKCSCFLFKYTHLGRSKNLSRD